MGGDDEEEEDGEEEEDRREGENESSPPEVEEGDGERVVKEASSCSKRGDRERMVGVASIPHVHVRGGGSVDVTLTVTAE